MAASAEAPFSGVFRAVYFLAVGLTCLFVVLTAISAFYDPPEGDASISGSGNPFFQDESFEPDAASDEREDYNRNVSLIFVTTAAGAFALAIFGLGKRFNPLRAGLTLGGLLLFLTGMGFWTDSTSEWLGFISSAAILLLLTAGFPSLDDGYPLRRAPANPPRRLTPEEVALPREDEPPASDERPETPNF